MTPKQDLSVSIPPASSYRLARLFRECMKAAEHDHGIKLRDEDWQLVNAMAGVREVIRREIDSRRGLEWVDGSPLENASMGIGTELTLADVADRLDVTVEAVRRRVMRGTLPALKDDRGRWLIPESALSAPTERIAVNYVWSPQECEDALDAIDLKLDELRFTSRVLDALEGDEADPELLVVIGELRGHVQKLASGWAALTDAFVIYAIGEYECTPLEMATAFNAFWGALHRKQESLNLLRQVAPDEVLVSQ